MKRIYAKGAFWLGRAARLLWDASEWCDVRARRECPVTAATVGKPSGEALLARSAEWDSWEGEDPLPEVPLDDADQQQLSGSAAARRAAAARLG